MNSYIKSVTSEVVKKIILPVLLFLLILVFYIFYRFKISLWLSAGVNDVITKWIVTFVIISVAFFLQRIAGALFSWYRENIAVYTRTSLDDEFIPLLRRTVKTGIWIVASLVILPLFGLNISALVTTLGVSSLAIALACQDTIANVIAGFMIMIDRPFRVGDKIKLPSGEVVKVLNIGIRRSHFLGEDKSVIIVPNLELSKSKIVNFTYGEERIQNND